MDDPYKNSPMDTRSAEFLYIAVPFALTVLLVGIGLLIAWLL